MKAMKSESKEVLLVVLHKKDSLLLWWLTKTRSDLGTSLREVAPGSFLRERPGCVAPKTSLPACSETIDASDLRVSL
ncbi:hypothetical protein F2Q69_00034482 [Brassica cretica]|uniref:Uncharacterized protein n=1 Tax=Brassica cretica TaxID=69181 RepID=A0A8S9SBW8_BRACR|nr:hypothetical protein F2Q69_00034482 [Brassica cretica]